MGDSPVGRALYEMHARCYGATNRKPMDQAACLDSTSTIQVMPNLSVTMPKRSLKNVLSAGITTWPPWASALIVLSTSALSAALIASAAIPPLLLWLQYLPLSALFAVLSAILWFKHRANIRRLTDGTEGKIGAKG